MTDSIVMPADVAALPEDALLLHIGIHKTGTTALQSTLRLQRPALLEHQVTYPKTTDTAALAVRSLLGREMGWERTLSRRDRHAIWNRFASEVQPLQGRVVVSAEALCQSGDLEAATVVDDLGVDRIHVVVGVRAFGGLLTSSWQQYLKTGRSMPFEEWLHEVLADPRGKMDTPSFWMRNDIPVLLRRWAALVGPERMTVIVTDPSQREAVPDTFERLLALPKGMLGEQAPPKRSNRSLSAAEAELLRRVNEVARTQMRSVDYLRVVRDGGALQLVESRVPSLDEQRLGLPAWTLPRVEEISERHVAAIEALRAEGATVVGDVQDLLKPPMTDDSSTPTLVPIDAAVALTLGAVLRTSSAPNAAAENVERKPDLSHRIATALPASVRRRLGRLRR